MAPSRSIRQNIKGVTKAIGDAKRALEAPASRRGALSDWDKMMAKAKGGQAADFARSQAKLARFNAADAAKRARRTTQVADHHKMMLDRMGQFRSDHSAGAGLAAFTEGAAVAGVTALAAALTGE